MPASSTVVNTAESADLRLVHLLGDHSATSPFVLTCEDHISNQDAPNLLTTIFQHQPAVHILMNLEKDEAVGAVSLLGTMLDRMDETEENGVELTRRILQSMVTAIESYVLPKSTKESEQGLVEKKLHMLCALYNIRSYSPHKVWILSHIVSLSVSLPSYTEMMLSLLPGRNATLGDLISSNHFETNIFDESITQEDRRRLYASVAKAVGQVEDHLTDSSKGEGGEESVQLEKEASAAGALKQKFLLKFLATYDEGSGGTAVDAEGLEAAKEAAVGAIRDPVNLFHEQRGIMGLSPVAALEKNDETKPLHTLLHIFQEKKLQDFQAFHKDSKTSPTLSKYDLSPEECIRHMRLLSLCSLATEHEEIPYDAIAKTLEITDDSEVETWVIAAVSSGLLSAKMDQLQRVVMVEKCVVRKFGMEQWKILQKRLDVWKKNVRGVLDGLKQSQSIQ